VQSKVGEGSTFTVFLPLTPPAAGPKSKASGSVA
jgi:signal transduction histidine kinase